MLFTTLVKKMMFLLKHQASTSNYLNSFCSMETHGGSAKNNQLTLGSWLSINLEKKHAKVVLFICPYNLELYFVLFCTTANCGLDSTA